jgi:hypothetical protein
MESILNLKIRVLPQAAGLRAFYIGSDKKYRAEVPVGREFYAEMTHFIQKISPEGSHFCAFKV